ncbi:MAG: hypothetical protein WCJ35_09945 [Planctomycetota bacterium]
MKRLGVASAIGIVLALACLIAKAAEESAGRMLKPCVTITGADSHVAIHRYHRITSHGVLTRIWQEHMGQNWQDRRERMGQRRTDPSDLREPLTCPMIDFDKYMVIGIFQGEGVNSTGLKVFSISEEDNRILFRYDENSYQTMGRVGSSHGGDKVTVYGFFVLPRSTKRMVLEKNVQNYLGQPPVWKQQIAFPELVAPAN